MSKKAIVIGAGFGGLSAAAYLAKQGHSVTVLEKNSKPGGRAMINKTRGYTFDLGPSWYLMPDVFEEFFADFGKKPSDFYKLKKLDPSYKVFESGESYDVKTVPGANKLFDKLQPGSSEQLETLLQKTQNEYDTVRAGLLTTPQKSFSEVTTHPEALKFIANPELMRSYHSRIKKYIKDARLQRILEFMTVFMGGSPKNIPAIYSLLAYVDFGLGVRYPMGGMGELVNAFVQVAKDLGVNILHNQEVSKIITSNKKASGVKLKNGKELRADIVIANADYNFVETKLLDQEHRTYKKEYWDKKTVSPSGLLIYMGVKKRVPNLRHHNLFFDTNWDQHFDNVFNAKKWSENPLFYLCAPTKTDASVAPKSCENIFVLAPQAAGKQPSKKTIEKTVQNIIKRIEQKVGQDFSGDIEVLDVRAQDYFTQTFNALDGNAFGLSHTMLQSGPLRPKMQSKKVKNLYYVGQYTNPGTGVPLVVLSGKTVAKLVSKNEK